MKQLIYFPLLAFLVAFNTASAQDYNFGVKAAGQLMRITHLNDGKDAILYNGGAFLEVPLINRLNMQTEVLFSAQGVNDEASSDYKQRNMYIQVPITARYQVWNRLSVHAGIQAGWLLSAKLKIKDGETKDSYDNKEDYKKLDYGVLAGAEFLLTKNLGIGARLNWGLSEIFKDYDKSRQYGLQAFVSYRFHGASF